MTRIDVDELPERAGKVRRKRRELEHELQVSVMQWCQLQVVAKARPELAWIMAVPNGGDRHPAVAAKLKAEGVKSGVPDLFLPVPRGGRHGLFIELKAGKNTPDANQVRWAEWLHSQGYCVATCWTFDAAVLTLTEYLDGKLTRPRAAGGSDG